MLLPRPRRRVAGSAQTAAIESVHRTANESNERRAPVVELADALVCECECHRPECATSFRITVAAYEAVRMNGRRFIVAPGHEHEDEAIISAGDTYYVIEKLGDEGQTAQDLDPR